ncbi:MAG: hypothetical protein WBY44_16050 [Bryobacteraceae bacterium]
MKPEPIPIRLTCDPEMTQGVLVVGEGPEAISFGIPYEQLPQLIEEANIAGRLILAQRRKLEARAKVVQ